MNKKILFAVDGSAKCMQAAAGLAQLIADRNDYQLQLLHCSPLPSSPGPENRVAAAGDLASPGEGAEAIFAPTLSVLQENGVKPERIEIRIEPNSRDPGSDVLEAAKRGGFQTVAVARRGRTKTQSLLLGSVSGRVAHYAENRTVWIIDTPLNRTGKVLVAVEGVPECRALTYYAAEWLAGLPGLHYTLLHLLPPVPPTLWDDGHILDEQECRQREQERQSWRSDWLRRVEKFMDEAKHALIQGGVEAERIETRIEPMREGVALDLLEELERGKYQVVVIGKRSIQRKKMFLLGSHANKLLFTAKNSILCLVDAG